MGTDYSQKMEAWVDELRERIAELEAAIAEHRETCLEYNAHAKTQDLVLWSHIKESGDE